jgi:colanic acid biosynthesis glycosyl transferase WcaI
LAALYHYFHPDDVVSARHFSDFCRELAARGWQVEAIPCNAGCRDERKAYPQVEQWNGVYIHRVWRPRFRQASALGRVLNAVWMIIAWSSAILRRRNGSVPDVLLIGTDPVLSILVSLAVKRLRPTVRVAHWCYDLYPEAATAEGIFQENSLIVRLLKRVLRAAYRSCDLVADLGSCMRTRLEAYGHLCRKVTLVPWALSEPERVLPPDRAMRRQLFGNAAVALLYSGNFGRAHSCDEFLQLARCLRGQSIHFCFGVRGNRVKELRAAVRRDDSNVSFADFAPESELAKRLAAADVHLVSLRPEWTGVVVPSKFFGSLAAGRPVIFAGSPNAALAQWINAYGVGWVLDRSSIEKVARDLRRLVEAPDELAVLQRRCHEVYHAHFSRCQTMDRWDQELQVLLGTDRRVGPMVDKRSRDGKKGPSISRQRGSPLLAGKD